MFRSVRPRSGLPIPAASRITISVPAHALPVTVRMGLGPAFQDSLAWRGKAQRGAAAVGFMALAFARKTFAATGLKVVYGPRRPLQARTHPLFLVSMSSQPNSAGSSPNSSWRTVGMARRISSSNSAGVQAILSVSPIAGRVKRTKAIIGGLRAGTRQDERGGAGREGAGGSCRARRTHQKR